MKTYWAGASSWIFPLAACGLLSVASQAAAAPVHVRFQGNSTELTSEQLDSLNSVAAIAAKDPSVTLNIRAATKGLKKNSAAAVAENVRALRLFQALVRAGADPARVVISSVVPPKAVASEVAVEPLYGLAVKSTPKLVATQTAEATEVAVNFAPGSADPINLSNERLATFAAAMGQPGHAVVAIEGETAAGLGEGRAIDELRTLTLFKRLVRAGLPAQRVGVRSASLSEGAKMAADSDHVMMRWTSELAPKAAVTSPSEPAAESQETVVLPLVTPSPAIQ